MLSVEDLTPILSPVKSKFTLINYYIFSQQFKKDVALQRLYIILIQLIQPITNINL